MANKDYLADKASKKKSANKAVWVLLIFAALLVAMVVKIQLTGSLKPEFFSGLPTSDDAYEIAKEFIKPTLKSGSNTFDDSKYQFGTTSDSVYVIQTEVHSKDASGGEPITTTYKVTLRYKGGQARKIKNWSVEDMSQF